MAQILFYDYVENIAERRAPHREAHLARVNAELVTHLRIEPIALA